MLRLITYNVHKCIGGVDRKYDPERIVKTIAYYSPDIVLLQEVDSEAKRSNHDRQVDLLGDRLTLPHRVWYPNVRVRGGGQYGNAILSRFPLTSSNNIDLTIPPKKRRSVLHASVRVPVAEPGNGGSSRRTIHIYNMHLGLSGIERRMQLKRFLDSHPFTRLDRRTPIIVAGDFNDWWGTLGKALLEPAGFVRSGGTLRTFPAYAPVRALDSVYVRGSVRLNHVYRSHLKSATQASDHLPLILDLYLE